MKWIVLIVVLLVFLPLGAQLRTHYAPLPSLVHVRRRLWAAPIGRRVFFVGYYQAG